MKLSSHNNHLSKIANGDDVEKTSHIDVPYMFVKTFILYIRPRDVDNMHTFIVIHNVASGPFVHVCEIFYNVH